MFVFRVHSELFNFRKIYRRHGIFMLLAVEYVDVARGIMYLGCLSLCACV